MSQTTVKKGENCEVEEEQSQINVEPDTLRPTAKDEAQGEDGFD